MPADSRRPCVRLCWEASDSPWLPCSRCKKRAADMDRKAMPSEPVILEEGAIQAGATLAYPGNLGFWNLADFITLPTLVYQMAYPRTRVIRWRWLLM